MTKKRNSKHHTLFSCSAPEAQSAFLAGSFNGWNPTAIPLQRDSEGRWSIALDLAPGHYEFKFIVDGEWCCEPGCHSTAECPKCVPNPFGTMNRIVDVT